jgi:uridine phosphorylase
VIVGLVEILDHVIDLVVKPGQTDRILAIANLPTEPCQVADITIFSRINARIMTASAMFEVQVIAVFDVRGPGNATPQE